MRMATEERHVRGYTVDAIIYAHPCFAKNRIPSIFDEEEEEEAM